jgi:type I restriction enzyme M protein
MANQAKKDKFIAVLRQLGGSAGNGRLREALQWVEATYASVKEDLLAEGAIVPGRGRGGSVALAGPRNEETISQADVEEAHAPAPELAPPPVIAPAPMTARAPRANGAAGNLGTEAKSLTQKGLARRLGL